jgi:cell wall-associated NlpC family hydrolase
MAPAPQAPAAAPVAIQPASPPSPVAPELDTLGLVAYAASMQGRPYVLGGDTPEVGFDCSGLVQHVFRQFHLELPRNAFVMAADLPAIRLDELRAADLVFFNTQRAPHSHVGIYLGDGRFVHAPSPRTGRVIISRMDDTYWRPRLDGARRPAPAAGAFEAAGLPAGPTLAGASR